MASSGGRYGISWPELSFIIRTIYKEYIINTRHQTPLKPHKLGTLLLCQLWQEDIIGIVRFINACSHKMNQWVKHLISLVWLEEM